MRKIRFGLWAALLAFVGLSFTRNHIKNITGYYFPLVHNTVASGVCEAVVLYYKPILTNTDPIGCSDPMIYYCDALYSGFSYNGRFYQPDGLLLLVSGTSNQ